MMMEERKSKSKSKSRQRVMEGRGNLRVLLLWLISGPLALSTPSSGEVSSSTSPQMFNASSGSRRDCSHLSGRQLTDCECKGTLEKAVAAWSEGEVVLSASFIHICDPSSPGLSRKEKHFVGDIQKMSQKIEAAQLLTDQGRHRESVAEWDAVFKSAQDSGAGSWAKTYNTGLAAPYCSSLVGMLREEADASEEANTRLLPFLPSIVRVCGAAHNKSKGFSQNFGAKQRIGNPSAPAPHSDGDPSSSSGGGNFVPRGDFIGAQIWALNVLGMPDRALSVAESHGFRFYTAQGMDTLSGNSSEKGEGKSRAEEHTSGAVNASRADRFNVWNGVVRLYRKARALVVGDMVEIDLPDATATYSSELARSLASICVNHYGATSRVRASVGGWGTSLFGWNTLGRRKQMCFSKARRVDVRGAKRVEAAELFQRGKFDQFLAHVDQVLAPRLGGGEGKGAGRWKTQLQLWVHAQLSQSMVGRGVLRLIRWFIGQSWPLGWLAMAATLKQNGVLLANRLRALLSVGDLENALSTAEALAAADAQSKAGICLPFISSALLADQLLRPGSVLHVDFEHDDAAERAERALRIVDGIGRKWEACVFREVGAVVRRLKASALALLDRECEAEARLSLGTMRTQLGYEALGDCLRVKGERKHAMLAYIVSLSIALSWGDASRRTFGLLNLVGCKMVMIVVSVASDFVTVGAQVLAHTLGVLAERALMLAMWSSSLFTRAMEWTAHRGPTFAEGVWKEAKRVSVRMMAKARKAWARWMANMERARSQRRGGDVGGQGEGAGREKCHRKFRGLGDREILQAFGLQGVMGIMRCTKGEIRKAYHKLSLEHHPDKAAQRGVSHKCASENFIDLQNIYERAKRLC